MLAYMILYRLLVVLVCVMSSIYAKRAKVRGSSEHPIIAKQPMLHIAVVVCLSATPHSLAQNTLLQRSNVNNRVAYAIPSTLTKVAKVPT
jgi:hypothetical protein